MLLPISNLCVVVLEMTDKLFSHVHCVFLQNFQVGTIGMKQILQPPLARSRKTKIICAIGPSCWSVEMLGKQQTSSGIQNLELTADAFACLLLLIGELLDAGMNVARLNFSHGDHEMHARSLSNLRKAVEARPGCHCAVLLDTKGPEIRTGLLKGHTPILLEVREAVREVLYSLQSAV